MSPRTPTATGGAFAKDKLFGKRIDEEFALGERFLLMGGKIADERIDTELGTGDDGAELAKMLVRRVDENDQPVGRPFIVGTLASAIVQKVKELTADDVPALVEIRKVVSKKWKSNALVLQHVGSDDLSAESEIAAAFGIELDPFTGLDEAKPAAA